jgi:hypothetical protein
MSDPSGVPDQKRDGNATVGDDRTIEEVFRRLGPLVPPGGYALVAGAADWRRGGMSAPVPASLLPVLAAPHLTDRVGADLADHETFEAALHWATSEVNPAAALLRRQGTGSFTVSDYALDLFSRQDEPIPRATWSVLIEHATPRDLVGVGYTAEVVYGLSEVARQAWRSAADSGQADDAIVAAVRLGELLRRQGDVPGARAAFQQAIDSGHADHAPLAAGTLGAMLQELGDAEGARAAFQQAIDSGRPEAAEKARERLEGLPSEDFLRNVRRAAQSARERKASSVSIRRSCEPLDALIEAIEHLEAGATAVASARFGDVVTRNRNAGDNRTAEIVAEAGVWWLACQRSQMPINIDEINRFLSELVDRGDFREHRESALRCLHSASASLAHPSMYLDDQWRSNLEHGLAHAEEPERFRANAEHVIQYSYEFLAQSADLAASAIANRIVNGAPLMLWLRSFSAEALSGPMKQNWSPIMGEQGSTVRVMYPEAHELESVLALLNEDLPFVTAAVPFLTGVSLSAPSIPRIRLRNENWIYTVSGLIDVCDGIVVLVDDRRHPSLLSELRRIHQMGAAGKAVALIPREPPQPSIDLFRLLASPPAEDNDAQREEMSQLLEPIRSIPLSEDCASAAAAVRAAFGERWGFLQDLRSIAWQERVRARMASAD